MSLDGQVLVIGVLAIALNLFVWAKAGGLDRTEDELHRKDVFRRDGGDRLRLRARPAAAGPKGLTCSASDSKVDL